MSNIPQNPGSVKAPARLTDGEKWRAKKLEAESIAARMRRYPSLRARAARMMQCGDVCYSQYCPKCGHEHIVSGGLCRDRLCPICGWRLSLSRYSQMMVALDLLSDNMAALDIRCSMLTLTLRNCRIENLHDTLVSMAYAWNLIAKQKFFRTATYAWARSIEITYNAKSKTYHPHMHILLFGYGEALSDDTEYTRCAISAWKKALKLDYNPIYDHRAAYTTEDKARQELATVEAQETLSWREQASCAAKQAALEVSKYIMADKMALKIPQNHLLEFAEAIKGVRLIGYGGALKNARAALGLVDDQIDNPDIHKECPRCGAAMLNYILIWSGAGYMRVPLDKEADNNDE